MQSSAAVVRLDVQTVIADSRILLRCACFLQSCLAIEAPAESFNRWLLERKVVDRLPIDPLLPANCPIDISPSMHREIMNDLPMRLVKPKSSTDARRQLVKYAEAARRMIETRGTSLESRKVVKWHAEDALEWLRKQRNASYEDLLVSVWTSLT
jgi:phosphorylated CTD-interacting factor 1